MLISKNICVSRNRNVIEEENEELKSEDNKINILKDYKRKLKTCAKSCMRIMKDNREDRYAHLINDMFHKGIIDESGNFIEKIKENLI